MFINCLWFIEQAWETVFKRLDEKPAQSKLPVTQAQKLGYAYNW